MSTCKVFRQVLAIVATVLISAGVASAHGDENDPNGGCDSLVGVDVRGTGGGSVTSEPAGIQCSLLDGGNDGTCAWFFEPSDVVTLTATPEVGSSFLGWTGECQGVGPCVLNIDAAKFVTAKFSPPYERLHDFTGDPGTPGDGVTPTAALIQAADGLFYGTTAGTEVLTGPSGPDASCGNVFMTDDTGAVTVLHTFSNDGSDGCAPFGALVQAADGFFYGTTSYGGEHGEGTIFRMDSSGSVAILHSFDDADPADGASPSAALIEASNHVFYGTTRGGGAHGQGTVFRMIVPDPECDLDPAVITVMHSFSGDDGGQPWAPLIKATDEAFYGTTLMGGPEESVCDGCTPSGTVFRLHIEGDVADFETVTTFENGVGPIAPVLQTGDTTFYGVTVIGGDNGLGTIFKLDTSQDPAVRTAVHNFGVDGGEVDGGAPIGALIKAVDGALYGTTNFFGPFGGGTLFKVTLAGTDEVTPAVTDVVTLLHGFDAEPSDGPGELGPFAPLLQATDGSIYGSTSGAVIEGGAINPGTLFRWNPEITPKTAQTIAFGTLSDLTVFGADFTVSATASSTLPVSFFASGACSITGDLVHLAGSVGVCQVIASQAGDATYAPAPNVLQEFNVTKATTSLTLSNLNPTYNGIQKPVTVTTNPPGLTGVSVTYDGSATAPTNAGNYAIVASIVNDSYEATDVPDTLVIGQATATLSLSNLDQTANGTPRSATVTTTPLGLTGVSVTYDASATAPTNVGSYAVVASLTNQNYQATNATGTLNITGVAALALTVSPDSVVGGTNATATVTLTNPAPNGGAIVALSSDNTAAATVPTSITIPKGQKTKTFTVTTIPVVAQRALLLSASFGGTTTGATFTVRPPVPTSVTLNPATVVGGTSSTGTVTLGSKAPVGGLNVALASSNTTAATVAIAVTVPAGATSATFPVSTLAVLAKTTAGISVTNDGVTRTATLTVNPAALSSVTVNPTSVVGGTSSTGTVTLNGPAPAGGASVAVTSSNAAAQVSSPVVVPAGQSSITFPITTSPVLVNGPGNSVSADISGSYGGVTKKSTLKVLEPALSAFSLSPTSVKGGLPTTATVTLNAAAPAGGIAVKVKSDKAATVPDATFTVPAGQTSASGPVATVKVKNNTIVNVTADAGGAQQTVVLTVTK